MRFITAQVMLTLLILSSFPCFAQQSYTISSDQQFTVAGTSTIHDWEMVAKEGTTGSAGLILENGKLSKITSLKVEIPTKSLKSGKGAMDKNAYEALNAAKYPSIAFEMTEFLGITGTKIRANGKLTIAGKSQIIPLEVSYSISGNTVKFKGTHAILFSDFKIDAPTAVLGTIKTGDELRLSFEAGFSPKN
ncbi:YceI family protein [Algoriphagus sp. AGSA1]|uniref:YceI family protein n=1 Tax=Algoriphagus sp. AGSA1 TaxID=2907213 RepID=UPI001F26D85A|nr:YceI family protein [Algoriphagus sp. AGSA1]MCE7055434.1 YceI family protein [Algoriphagus sp. AGSA1]